MSHANGRQRPVTIGVDARELLGESTGVGRYLHELLRRWIARDDGAKRRFVLYTPEPLTLLNDVPPDANVREFVAGSGRGTWWEQTHLRRAIKSDPPDVFFAGAYTAPLALRLPLAVTVHDLSFAAHPEWFRPREGARRRLLTRQAARSAEIVFTDSAFSQREIIERLSVPAERIRVIPPGVTCRTPGTSPREPIVLFAGSILNRRRLPQLIGAFARATADLPDARLVIAGADRSYPPLDLAGLAAEAGVAPRVSICNYVSEEELNGLYARASVFVFLSEYEGFGMTPLEALSARVPIVVLDTAIAREVYGDAAWYVPQDAPAAAEEAIRTLLANPERGTQLLARAPAILQRFSWDTAAAQTLAGIEGITRA